MSTRGAFCGVAVVAVAFVWASVAVAESPPLSRAGEERAAAPVNSLAEAAARIRLRRPDDGGPLVITDRNLSELGRGGTLSITGPPAPVAPTRPPETGPTEAEREEFQRRLEDQERAVADLERTLREFEARVQQARDPMWFFGPENFAPGQVSPAQLIREDVQRDLAAEREKLEALRQEGRRAGILPGGRGR